MVEEEKEVQMVVAALDGGGGGDGGEGGGGGPDGGCSPRLFAGVKPQQEVRTKWRLSGSSLMEAE